MIRPGARPKLKGATLIRPGARPILKGATLIRPGAGPILKARLHYQRWNNEQMELEQMEQRRRSAPFQPSSCSGSHRSSQATVPHRSRSITAPVPARSRSATVPVPAVPPFPPFQPSHRSPPFPFQHRSRSSPFPFRHRSRSCRSNRSTPVPVAFPLKHKSCSIVGLPVIMSLLPGADAALQLNLSGGGGYMQSVKTPGGVHSVQSVS